MKSSVFKSAALRDEFRAQYNGILSGFPFEQKYVDTSYGKTFMLVAGDAANPPMILLHGSNSNSAFWFPEIMAFSAQYRVYAVDIVGECGNSEEYRLDLHSNDFANWMQEVQASLGIQQSIVIGNSLGGWMSIKFATTYPERVEKLILIASAGLAPVHHQFLQNVQNARQEDGSVPVASDIIEESDIPQHVLDFMNLIARSYDPILELPLFDDEALRKLHMPVLFVDGEDDVVIHAKESASRLLRIVPSAEAKLIPNCGHAITNAIEYLLPFLNENA